MVRARPLIVKGPCSPARIGHRPVVSVAKARAE